MGLFSKSHRQKLVELYKRLKNSDSPDTDVDTIITQYPKLELSEAILISGYLDRGLDVKEVDQQLRGLGIK
jgi:hypothetical protein